MPAEYQRRRERLEDVNRERLAQAARVILKDVSTQTANFGWAAGVLQGEPDADERIVGMIEFGIRLYQMGQDEIYDAIEAQSGMRVDVQDLRSGERRTRNGFLVALEGASRGEGTGKPFVRGHALVVNEYGSEEFVPVEVLENGTVFAIPQKPQE